MASLFEPLQAITGDPALTDSIGNQLGQLLAIAQQVKELIDQPPGDFGDYFNRLKSLPLPDLVLPGNLGEGLSDLISALQKNLGASSSGLLDQVGALEKQISQGLAERLKPLLETLDQLTKLLASDLSCGLIPGFAPPAANPPNGNPPPPAAAITSTQMADVKAQLATIPVEMTVRDLLIWVHGQVNGWRPAALFFRAIPLIDDLRDPLDSLVRWDGFTGTQLVQEFEQNLNRLATLIQNQTSGMITAAFDPLTINLLSVEPLNQSAQALRDALVALKNAVEAQDAAEITTQLAVAQIAETQIEAANLALDPQAAALEALRDRLQQLPGEMETGICRLLVLLSPSTSWADLTAPLAELPMPLQEDSFQPLTELLGRIQESLENLLGLMDVNVVTEPLTQLFNQAEAAVTALDQQIVQLTAAAQAQFQQARTALQAIDLSGFQQQMVQAIDQAATTIQQNLEQGLQPAADALVAAVTAISNAANGFDPEQIAQPVEQAISAIQSMFQAAELQQLLGSLQQLGGLVEPLKALSFRPVADLVISGIGEVKSALDSIDESNLSPPMPEMIDAAMSVLPASLDPMTEPLIGDLRDLIQQGPTEVLQQIRQLPARITEQLQQFSPKILLSEPLGKPYAQMRQQLDEFKPGSWLDAADQELESLRQRLTEALDLQPLLAPIAGTQRQLQSELQRFNPAKLMQPVVEQIDSVIDRLVDAIPTSSVIDALDQVVGRVRQLLQPLEAAVEIAQALIVRLSKLTDPRGQLDIWLGEILDKLPQSAPTTLAAALATLQSTIDETKSAAMATLHATARQTLADKLNSANANALHSQLTQARNQLAALTNLPVEVQSWIDTLKPLDPHFSRGLRQLTRLNDALNQSDQTIATHFADWNERYHHPDGPLASLAPELVTLEQWRSQLNQAINQQLGATVVQFCRQLFILSRLLESFSNAMTALLAAVNSKVDEVLAAPQALAAAGNGLQQLLQRLKNLDLALFSRETDAIYQQLLGQIQAIDPQQLLAPLRQHLTQTLKQLSLATVFTPALRQTLTQSYMALIQKLDGLDPEPLLIEPLEATYQQAILPLAQSFDVGETLDALQAWFDQLPAELQSELDRVDTAYQELLRTAPSGGGSRSLSL